MLAVVLLAATGAQVGRADQIVHFDDLTLAPNSHWGGDKNGTIVPGPYGPVSVNTFTSQGAQFVNRFDVTYESWSGFAYSNQSDTTTPGYLNQFSAFTGTGRGPGQDNYGIAFGYSDINGNLFDPTPFDPSDPVQLKALPTFSLPTASEIQGLYVTNTTYAALSMLQGDSFAKKFGQGDWFKLTAYGTDAAGNALSSFVDFYLADYRSSNAADWFLVNDWRFLDLSTLTGASQIHFNVSSSDVGLFGMNTPGYFAVDDVTYNQPAAAVPEPSSIAMLGIGAVVVGVAARRRRRDG